MQPCEDLYVGPTGARLLCERNESLGDFESLGEFVVIPSWEQRNELFEKGGGNETQGSRVLVGRDRIFDGRWGVAGLRDFNVAGRPIVQGSAGKEHKILTSSYSFFGELGEAVVVTDLTHNGVTVHCPYCTAPIATAVWRGKKEFSSLTPADRTGICQQNRGSHLAARWGYTAFRVVPSFSCVG